MQTYILQKLTLSKLKSRESESLALNDTNYIQRESRLVKQVCRYLVNENGQLTPESDQVIKFLLLLLDRPTDEDFEVTHTILGLRKLRKIQKTNVKNEKFAITERLFDSFVENMKVAVTKSLSDMSQARSLRILKEILIRFEGLRKTFVAKNVLRFDEDGILIGK